MTEAAAMPATPRLAHLLLERRFWLMLGFGFASGLPLPLSGFTLRQWLSEGHVALGVIGLTANIGLAYALKFLWSPVLDNPAPGPFARLGRRRGWLLVIQPLLSLACFAMAFTSPTLSPVLLISLAGLLAFCSATQDIAIDAWRIETFPEAMQGSALAAYVWGYRGALLVSGAGAIALATPWGWHGVFVAMAVLTLLGPALTLLAREPATTAALARALDAPMSLARRFTQSVAEPLREFLSRQGAVAVLLFVVLFRLGEALAGTMLPPFYRSLGYDRAQVALANGPVSLGAVLIGAALGGWLVARIGTARALVMTAFFQTLCMGMYVLLSYAGGSHGVLLATSAVESFAEGFADAAFLTYLSSLCDRRFSATQYALLSSIAALAYRTVGGLSGFMAAALGWHAFYAVTALATVPSLVVLIYLMRGSVMASALVRNRSG